MLLMEHTMMGNVPSEVPPDVKNPWKTQKTYRAGHEDFHGVVSDPDMPGLIHPVVLRQPL